jgi:Zn-dependent metalloprotease
MNAAVNRPFVLRPFLPPYILDPLVRAENLKIRQAAVDTVAASAAMRAMRSTLAALPIMAAIPSAGRSKERLIYDMRQRTYPLPGAIVLCEGEKKLPADKAVREAYANLGITYDFFKTVFGRNSMDDEGMSLIASLHYGTSYNNAFWNGEQMVFGDGDGRLFRCFTKSLDVVAHELAHGVIAHTCNLEYFGQSGALNEHFADVFGILAEQWHLDQTAAQAAWLVGAELIGPQAKIKAVRTFKAEKAYRNDPLFGTDPQPKHMKDFYDGGDDDGGVHINSGIPNHAFYRAAVELGGKAWETLGPIWYHALAALGRKSDIAEAAKTTREIARRDRGPKSREAAAVAAGWKAVGVKE